MPGYNIFNKNIIATVTKCVTPDCKGWLTDAFAGKYLIKCIDSKHNTTSNDMAPAKEIVGDLAQNDSLRQITKP